MKRNVVSSDAPYGYLLVEYDPENPDPCFTPECIAYIESRQEGLTPRDIAKLDEIEWFTFHRHIKAMNEFVIPGLRPQGGWETCYVKRISDEPYLQMMNRFLSHIPVDFPQDQIDLCHMKGLRLTSYIGENFYPIEYKGNITAWRKRMIDNSKYFRTLIAHFENGKFAISDGRRIEFADMDVASTSCRSIPDDF